MLRMKKELKSKSKKVNKMNNIETLINHEQITKEDKNGSILVNCFQCQSKVIVRWNKPRKKFSEKNNFFCIHTISKFKNSHLEFALIPILRK